jgi:hypothetical protein
MIEFARRTAIPVLSLGVAVGMCLSPAMAEYYSPGPYMLTPNGTYAAQDNNPNCDSGSCSFEPADFAHGASYDGGPTTYDYLFSVAANTTDYFNVSGAFLPTDNAEELTVQSSTCTSIGSGPSCSGQTLLSGITDLLNVPEPNGYSIAYSGGAGGTNYLVQLQLVTDDDPSNDISVTSSALGAVVTPLPAAFPLFATGLGALGLLGWRRKRKAQAAV